MSPNIALWGKARSGKDTVAARLCEAHGYTRLAFADPLKDMALSVDPFVTTVAGQPVRLSEVVKLHGWDGAKSIFPEVRRLLQHMGQTVRERDRSFWIRTLLRSAVMISGPIVVTDVRYPNEFKAMQRAGFQMVQIRRPAALRCTLADSMSQHESETALDDFTSTLTLTNDRDIPALHLAVDYALQQYLSE